MNRGISRMLLDPASKDPKYAVRGFDSKQVDAKGKSKLPKTDPKLLQNLDILQKIETLLWEEHKMGFGCLPTVVTNFKT